VLAANFERTKLLRVALKNASRYGHKHLHKDFQKDWQTVEDIGG
jgi:hypothetical protein